MTSAFAGLPRLGQTKPLRLDPPSPKRSGSFREPAHPASAHRQAATTTCEWGTSMTVNDRHQSDNVLVAPTLAETWRARRLVGTRPRAGRRAQVSVLSLDGNLPRSADHRQLEGGGFGSGARLSSAAPIPARWPRIGQWFAGGGSMGGGASVPAASARAQVSHAI